MKWIILCQIIVICRKLCYYFYNLKIGAAESDFLFGEISGKNVLSKCICRRWFMKIKCGSFDGVDEESGGKNYKHY